MFDVGLVNRTQVLIHVEIMISADLDGKVRIMLHREQVRQQLSNTTPQAKLTWNKYVKYLGYVKLPQTCTVSSDCSLDYSKDTWSSVQR